MRSDAGCAINVRRLRDLLKDGPMPETAVREILGRDYLHGRALRAHQHRLLASRRRHRKQAGVGGDGTAREIDDVQRAAQIGRRYLATARISQALRKGWAIRETAVNGVVYLRLPK